MSLACLFAYAANEPPREQPIAEPGDAGVSEERVPLPEPRQEIGVVALGGEVFVLGGFDEGSNVIDTVFAYDPEADAWEAIAAMPDFTERGGAGVAVLHGKIYVVGGYRSGSVSDVSRYDPVEDAWETLPSLPVVSDHLVAGAFDGKVYAFAGRSGGIGGHRPLVYAFDPGEGTWEEKAAMPTSRAGAAGAQAEGRYFVFGGEGNPEDPDGVFPQAESYDPSEDAWELLSPMPTPRHGMGAAEVGGVIYVPGGAMVQGLGAVDTHEAYIP